MNLQELVNKLSLNSQIWSQRNKISLFSKNPPLPSPTLSCCPFYLQNLTSNNDLTLFNSTFIGYNKDNPPLTFALNEKTVTLGRGILQQPTHYLHHFISIFIYLIKLLIFLVNKLWYLFILEIGRSIILGWSFTIQLQ